MKYLRYVALLALLAMPLAYSQAQVRVGVGIGVGPGYVAGPPVCSYGYYPDYPYACAPYGYYGPSWFANGIFIGAGPWFHGGWGHGYYAPAGDTDITAAALPDVDMKVVDLRDAALLDVALSDMVRWAQLRISRLAGGSRGGSHGGGGGRGALRADLSVGSITKRTAGMRNLPAVFPCITLAQICPAGQSRILRSDRRPHGRDAPGPVPGWRDPTGRPASYLYAARCGSMAAVASGGGD